MFLKSLEGKISLSLDAWTSSNRYAFLAIVAHYITNEGECGEFPTVTCATTTNIFLEELLIDFRELIGQHSGENMASVVWSTLETYNIQDKVFRLRRFHFYFTLTDRTLDNCCNDGQC